jgi:hypothetical protein
MECDYGLNRMLLQKPEGMKKKVRFCSQILSNSVRGHSITKAIRCELLKACGNRKRKHSGSKEREQYEESEQREYDER